MAILNVYVSLPEGTINLLYPGSVASEKLPTASSGPYTSSDTRQATTTSPVPVSLVLVRRAAFGRRQVEFVWLFWTLDSYPGMSSDTVWGNPPWNSPFFLHLFIDDVPIKNLAAMFDCWRAPGYAWIHGSTHHHRLLVAGISQNIPNISHHLDLGTEKSGETQNPMACG